MYVFYGEFDKNVPELCSKIPPQLEEVPSWSCIPRPAPPLTHCRLIGLPHTIYWKNSISISSTSGYEQLDIPRVKYLTQTLHFVASDLDLHCLHYGNTPIQIYRKFHLQKLKNFQMKNSDIFHTSAQNIDCGYSLELPR